MLKKHACSTQATTAVTKPIPQVDLGAGTAAAAPAGAAESRLAVTKLSYRPSMTTQVQPQL